MASPGNPEDIAALNISVGGDAADFNAALDKLQSEAPAKGEAIGKAVGEGINKGTAEAAKSGAGGSGSSDAHIKSEYQNRLDELDKGVDARMAAVMARPGAAPTTGGGDASGGNGLGILAALTTQFERFEKYGEQLSNAIIDATKQQLELRQAIAQMTVVLAQSAAIQEKLYNERTGGNRNVGNVALKRNAEMDSENANLEKEYIDDGYGGLRDAVEAGIQYGSPAGWIGRLFGVRTRKEQVRSQIEENSGRLANNARQNFGISSRERSRGTMEGLMESEAGLPPGSVQAQGPVDQVEATMIRDVFKGSPDMLDMLLKVNTGTYEQQLNATKELLRGNGPRERGY